ISQPTYFDFVATPSAIMHQYLECINDGDVKRTVTEDCILNLFARTVQGDVAVASYLRTQLSGRYKHTDFEMPSCCEPAHQEVLKTRYTRRFENHWKRKMTPIDDADVVAKPASDEDGNKDKDEYKDKAGNEDEAEDKDKEEERHEDKDGVKKKEGAKQEQVTPPRPTEVTSKLQYIESLGVLKSLYHNTDMDGDGGLDFGEYCQVRLVLGFRRASAPQLCLIIYEKLRPRSSRLPIGVSRPHSQRNVHTDDEGETPPRLNVRRTLFGPGDDDPDALDTSPLIDVELSRKKLRSLNRKRQHAIDLQQQQQQKATKYKTTVFNSMRF
ncbi:hypothetical protein KR093_007185, partial [Drosophila rubida]